MHFSCTDVARGARGIMSKGWQASTHMSVSLLGAAVTCCLHQLAEVCAMVGWSDLQPGQQVTQCRCAVDGCGRVFLSEYHRHCCSECVRSQGERHTRRCDQHQQRRAQHYAQDAPATNTWQGSFVSFGMCYSGMQKDNGAPSPHLLQQVCADIGA